MYPALIQWFVTVVPMCSLVTPMHSILRLMESDPSAQILVIDRDKKPLGVVACHELLLGAVYSHPLSYGPSLRNRIALNQGKLTAVCSVLADTGDLEFGHQANDTAMFGASMNVPVDAPAARVLPDSIAQESLQSCLDALTHAKGRSPLQPIETIPAYASLDDFRSQFMARLPVTPTPGTPPLEWVVMSKQDKVIGLVNQQQVWRTLALSTVKPSQWQGRVGQAVKDPKQDQQSDSRVGPDWPLRDVDLTSIFATGGIRPTVEPVDASTNEIEASVSYQSQDREFLLPSPDEGRPEVDGSRQALLQRLEEAQTQIQALQTVEHQQERQLRFKDELLAHVSHELKTPLTALIGLSELITLHSQSSPGGEDKKQQAQLSKKQELYAHLMNHSSHQLMALMTTLFDLIHIETGQLALSVQQVALEALLEDAYQSAWQNYAISQNPCHTDVGSAASSAHAKETNPKRETAPGIDKNVEHRHGVSVSRSPAPTPLFPPPLRIDNRAGIEHVRVDDYYFRRLWISLLVNALQLTEAREGPVITIDTRGKWIAFKLHHTGPKLPTRQQVRIFETIDTVDDKNNSRFKNIDVRLLLALRLSQEHEGALTWISHDAKGFEVTVLLPEKTWAISQEESSSALDLSAGNTNPGFVVIADSDPARIFQLYEAITALGYGVAIARSGREALEKVRCLRPQAILLDPSMGYDSARTLCAVLREEGSVQSIPVIATVPVPEAATVAPCVQFPLNLKHLEHQLSQVDSVLTGETIADPSTPKTLLYFNPYAVLGHALKGHSPSFAQDTPCLVPQNLAKLNAMLHPHHYRVIEIDSIEQAELLTRVWHPDVMLIGGIQGLTSRSPAHALLNQSPSWGSNALRQSLIEMKQHHELSELPIITLTSDGTECANGLGLRVFPCPTLPMSSDSEYPELSATGLSQVIQLAAASRSLN